MNKDSHSAKLQRQRCKACWNADGFDFNVPSWVWEAVVPEDLRAHVVCLRCFDDFASAREVRYHEHLGEEVYFAGTETALLLRVVRRGRISP